MERTIRNDERDFHDDDATRQRRRVLLVVVAVLQAVMAVELVALASEGLWISAVWLVAIMAITGAPVVLRDRLPVRIPPEWAVAAILFVFATLFLGEYRSYYDRYWWWDVALHASSGLLLGLLGFLLVYVLNESRRIDVHMRPGFVALFAFAFAVTAGTLWEVFEFAVDRLLGGRMQKPMAGDPSGLTDTMWDLIVDTAGAAVVSLVGWRSIKGQRRSWIEAGIERFVDRNPRLFGGR